MYTLYDLFKSSKTNNKNERKLEVDIIEKNYFNQILGDLSSMIVYDNINSEYFNSIKTINGYAILTMINGELVALEGSLYGKRNAYGMGTEVKAHDMAGNTYDLAIGENCILAMNTQILEPQISKILYYADMLTTIDISMDCNIFNSRYSNIVTVKNSKLAETVKTILNNIQIGQPSITTANLDSLTRSPIEQSTRLIDVLSLTDPNNADKLQYLSRLHDDIIRRVYIDYGIEMQGSEKLAQQTTVEITQNKAKSLIYPTRVMEQARLQEKQCKELFGIALNPRFTEPWRKGGIDNETNRLAKSTEGIEEIEDT